jgi:hypothetical protein
MSQLVHIQFSRMRHVDGVVACNEGGVCAVLPSRFFARPLAELITSQGRDILQSTVDLVNDMGVPGLEVRPCWCAVPLFIPHPC